MAVGFLIHSNSLEIVQSTGISLFMLNVIQHFMFNFNKQWLGSQRCVLIFNSKWCLQALMDMKITTRRSFQSHCWKFCDQWFEALVGQLVEKKNKQRKSFQNCRSFDKVWKLTQTVPFNWRGNLLRWSRTIQPQHSWTGTFCNRFHEWKSLLYEGSHPVIKLLLP